MKKSMCIYSLIFIISVFYLSIPKVVFGQLSDAQQVFNKYNTLLKRPDIQELFPGFLRILKKSDLQDLLDPSDIEILLNNPVAYRTLDPGINNQFLLLMATDGELRKLFRDPQFHIIFDDPVKIEEFAQLIEAELPRRPARIEIVSGDNQNVDSETSLQPFVVVVKNENGKALSGVGVAFEVIFGKGGSLSPKNERTNTLGQARTTLILGDEPGIHKVKASVDGYPSLTQTFTAAATGAECEVPPQPIPTTLEIISGDNQSGESGMPLAKPFIVRVKNRSREPLPGINVTFKVTAGGGQLWGQKIQTVTTNQDGQAGITLILGNARVNEVEVSIAGVSQKQRFTATSIGPTAQLPSVYWIENGALYYRPTGGPDPEEPLFQPTGGTLTGGLAVDMKGKRIYWTERSNNGIGRIRSTDLTGGAGLRVELRRTDGVPLGVAVNTEGDRVYWTTSEGKIQHIGVRNIRKGQPNTGSIKDVEVNPNSPKTHIAFDEEGGLYWTEPTGIRKKWQKDMIVAVSDDKLGGIAVAGGRVYWTEQTNGTQGAVRWKEINGRGGTGKFLVELVGSVPKGIAVDAAGGRMYWTTSLGEIQSAPVPEGIEAVISSRIPLGSGIALGNGVSTSSVAAAPSISSVGSQENTLLANYPNPFNPETWIPYQLSQSADVTVSIYSVNGQLVRTLALGHQSAGVYRSRSRAAYWDGRNNVGERVASGLYFYTLTAGDFTATRKMLIRK